jgi:hypothetical protein
VQLTCKRCKQPIAAAQMNVERDLAVCSSCDEAYLISDLLAEGQGWLADAKEPPAGAWFRESFDGWDVGATTRSWQALFLVPFTCVWSGGSLGGIYGSQIVHGQFNLFMTLFGIPFVIGSVFLWGITIMSIFGTVAVNVVSDEATLFTGAFGLGRRKRFVWSTIKVVKDDVAYQSSRGGPRAIIVLEGVESARIRLGSMLSQDRLAYLRDVLRGRLSRR